MNEQTNEWSHDWSREFFLHSKFSEITMKNIWILIFSDFEERSGSNLSLIPRIIYHWLSNISLSLKLWLSLTNLVLSSVPQRTIRLNPKPYVSKVGASMFRKEPSLYSHKVYKQAGKVNTLLTNNCWLYILFNWFVIKA